MKKIATYHVRNENSLIVMVGSPGSGKTTFIKEHFPDREVVSSDAVREELTGDFRHQHMFDETFTIFHNRIREKLAAGQRVVADATHIRDRDRKSTALIAKDLGLPIVYMVVDRPLQSKITTGGWRNDIRKGKRGLSLVEATHETFMQNLPKIRQGDGLTRDVIEVETTEVIVKDIPMVPTLDAIRDMGFNHIRAIGDVHGDMSALLKATDVSDDTLLLFLGDVLDYGVDTLRTASEVSELIAQHKAVMIRGNHEKKVMKWVQQSRTEGGFQGMESYGNAITFNQIKALTPEDRFLWEQNFLGMMFRVPDVIRLGNHLFTHGAAHHTMWDQYFMFRFPDNSVAQSYAMYGQTLARKKGDPPSPDGFPTRIYDWVQDIPARHTVVVGHDIRNTEVPLHEKNPQGGEAIFVDTGSSKGGILSWVDFDIEEDDLRQTGEGHA